jgi:uncharacterized membrane protein YtjA (UPF0391 family)
VQLLRTQFLQPAFEKARDGRPVHGQDRWHDACENPFADQRPGFGWLADQTDAFEESTMLYYAIVFFVIALIAAALGFGGIAGAATGIAKILFFVFLILFIASLIFGGLRRR